MRMIIDHDPNERPHKVMKLAAVLTVIMTFAVMIPLTMGIRWFFDVIPPEAVFVIDALIFGALAGFFFGRWDATRQFRGSKPGIGNIE